MARSVVREGVQWGVTARCRPGERTTGDVGLVTRIAGGTLVAGIDGLGHGNAAARAAQTAAHAVRSEPTADLVSLVARCHGALQGTRGAAISLAFMSHLRGQLTWLGVGNVEGRVVSIDSLAPGPKGSLALAGGVVGHEMPAVITASVQLAPGDVVILATDGIESGFADSLDVSGSPQAISERIVDRHWTRPDDAMVVAVRYLGPPR